ncbi:MAG: DUF4176 domain-containing protein [Bacteroidales bacterium]|nr:DUF4176 domain-containing protein [Bacteroidales bacterium]
MKSLLPIGSVVLLNGGEKRLMICGRVQTDVATGKTYDYSACFYPDGIISSKELFMFNNENIRKIFFIGFQDGEEFAFRQFMEEQLSAKENNN